MEDSIKTLYPSLAEIYRMENLNPAMDQVNGLADLDKKRIDIRKLGILFALNLVKESTINAAQENQKVQQEALELFNFCSGLSKIDLSNPQAVKDFINNMLQDKDLPDTVKAQLLNLQDEEGSVEKLINDMKKQQEIMNNNPVGSKKYLDAEKKCNDDNIQLEYAQKTYSNNISTIASKAQATESDIQQESDLISNILIASSNQ